MKRYDWNIQKKNRYNDLLFWKPEFIHWSCSSSNGNCIQLSFILDERKKISTTIRLNHFRVHHLFKKKKKIERAQLFATLNAGQCRPHITFPAQIVFSTYWKKKKKWFHLLSSKYICAFIRLLLVIATWTNQFNFIIRVWVFSFFYYHQHQIIRNSWIHEFKPTSQLSERKSHRQKKEIVCWCV